MIGPVISRLYPGPGRAIRADNESCAGCSPVRAAVGLTRAMGGARMCGRVPGGPGSGCAGGHTLGRLGPGAGADISAGDERAGQHAQPSRHRRQPQPDHQPSRSGYPKADGHFTSDGKPEIVTVELAWCPHCAANSWALAVALSRFGTLHRAGRDQHRHLLLQGRRGSVHPESRCRVFRTRTGSASSTLTTGAAYISFAAIVLQDVNGRNLEKPTRREQRSLTDGPSTRSLARARYRGCLGLSGVRL